MGSGHWSWVYGWPSIMCLINIHNSASFCIAIQIFSSLWSVTSTSSSCIEISRPLTSVLLPCFVLCEDCLDNASLSFILELGWKCSFRSYSEMHNNNRDRWGVVLVRDFWNKGNKGLLSVMIWVQWPYVKCLKCSKPKTTYNSSLLMLA